MKTRLKRLVFFHVARETMLETSWRSPLGHTAAWAVNVILNPPVTPPFRVFQIRTFSLWTIGCWEVFMDIFHFSDQTDPDMKENVFSKYCFQSFTEGWGPSSARLRAGSSVTRGVTAGAGACPCLVDLGRCCFVVSSGSHWMWLSKYVQSRFSYVFSSDKGNIR